MNIPNEMIVKSVEHRYAGNGWAVVATYPGEWASVVNVGKGEIGHQFFSVWSKLLKPESELRPEIAVKIDQIRKDLASGKKAIVNTRLVKV